MVASQCISACSVSAGEATYLEILEETDLGTGVSSRQIKTCDLADYIYITSQERDLFEKEYTVCLASWILATFISH